MKNSKFISLIIFTAFFLAGWQLGISPIKQSWENSKNIILNFKHRFTTGGPLVRIPHNYISNNQYKIDVLHYNLNIDLYPKEKILKGNAVITGVFIDKNISSLDFNFYNNFNIQNVEFNGNKTPYKLEGTRISMPIGNIKSDTFNIKIVYEGTPKRMGLSAFVFGEINGESLIYNLSEPVYASTWFPCNDYPSDKALLDISITNDSDKVSVSNGKLINIKRNGSRNTYHWRTFYPISTYLICLYSSDYKHFSDFYISQDKKDTMSIDYYAIPKHYENAKIDFANHPQMIGFLAKSFGEYPFIKEKYGVAEFLWQMGAMENQTITGIGSNFIGGKNFFDDIYLHELAHQWFGDAVGPATWKDIWLNEGFATYAEALYSEYLAGSAALRSKMMSIFQSNFTGKLYDPGEDMFGSTVYDKGAWVLHMLRWEVGDSTFFKIMRTYFETYKYKNASTNDFKTVCEKVSGKNFNQFFDQWVFNGEGDIDLEYIWNVKNVNNSYVLFLTLKQTQSGYPEYKFPLQLEIVYSDNTKEYKTFYVDKRQKMLQFSILKKDVKLIMDPDNWLLANFKENNDTN